jgi:hypothetical protein
VEVHSPLPAAPEIPDNERENSPSQKHVKKKKTDNRKKKLHYEADASSIPPEGKERSKLHPDQEQRLQKPVADDRDDDSDSDVEGNPKKLQPAASLPSAPEAQNDTDRDDEADAQPHALSAAVAINPLSLADLERAQESGEYLERDATAGEFERTAGDGSFALDIPTDKNDLKRRRSTVLGLLDLHGAVTRQDNVHIFAVTMVIILFLTYPSILTWDANILRCESLDFGELQVDGSYSADVREFFYFDRSVDCSSAAHREYVKIGIAFGVIYAVGTPLAAATLFTYFRRPRSQGGIGRRDASRMFTFLIAGYRRDVWWWEAPVLLRKASLIYISTFLQGRSEMQTLLAFWVLVVYLVGHMVVQPYEYETVDRMERYSLIIICVTLNLSLTYSWFDTGSPDNVAYGVIVTIVLLVIHLSFLIWMIHAIVAEGTIKVQKWVRDNEELLVEYFSEGFVSFLMTHVAYKAPAVLEVTVDGGVETLEQLSPEELEIAEVVAESGSEWSDDESFTAEDDAAPEAAASDLNATFRVLLNSGSSFIRPATGNRRQSTARRASRAASVSVEDALAAEAAAGGAGQTTGRVWRSRSLVPPPETSKSRRSSSSDFVLEGSSGRLGISVELGQSSQGRKKSTAGSFFLAPLAESSSGSVNRDSITGLDSKTTAANTDALVGDLGAVIDGMQQHTDDLLLRYNKICQELQRSKALVEELRTEIAALHGKHHDEYMELIKLAERCASLEETINSLKMENATLSLSLRRRTEDAFLDADPLEEEHHQAALRLIASLTDERNQLLQRLARLDMEGRPLPAAAGASTNLRSTARKLLDATMTMSMRSSSASEGHDATGSPFSTSLAIAAGGTLRLNDASSPGLDDAEADENGFARPKSQKSAPPLLDEKIRILQEAAEAENAAINDRIQQERESQLRAVEDHLRKKREARLRSQLLNQQRLSSGAGGSGDAVAAGTADGQPPGLLHHQSSLFAVDPHHANLAPALSEALFGAPLRRLSAAPPSAPGTSSPQTSCLSPVQPHGRPRRSIVEVLQEYEAQQSGTFTPVQRPLSSSSQQQHRRSRQASFMDNAAAQSSGGNLSLGAFQAFPATPVQSRDGGPSEQHPQPSDGPEVEGTGTQARPPTGNGRPTTTSSGRRVYNNIPDSALAQAFPAERFAAVESLESGRVLVVKKRHNKISQRATRWF